MMGDREEEGEKRMDPVCGVPGLNSGGGRVSAARRTGGGGEAMAGLHLGLHHYPALTLHQLQPGHPGVGMEGDV